MELEDQFLKEIEGMQGLEILKLIKEIEDYIK